jgi:hypothetical protein
MSPFGHVLVFTLCFSSGAAILFGGNTPVAHSRGRAVEQSCLALADQGSCQFYTCFEARLPCGRDWYILRSGQYYCNKIQRERSRFSAAGQQFLDAAQLCLTRSLKSEYEREYVDCHDLEHAAVANITPCYTENGFCNLLDSDARNFISVYELRDLFTRGAAKVWREIASLAASCGRQALQEFSSNTGGAITNFFNSLSDRFGK